MNRDKEVEAYIKGQLSSGETVKYEIARELGLLDRVLTGGWRSLSAKETGRIGGLMARQSRDGQSVDGRSKAGQSANGQSVDGRSKAGQSANGQSVDGWN